MQLAIILFDIVWSQMAFAFGNENMHRFIQQDEAQMLAFTHRPWQSVTIIIATFQISQIVQADAVDNSRFPRIRLSWHDIMKHRQTNNAQPWFPDIDDPIQFDAFVFFGDFCIDCRRALEQLNRIVEMGIRTATFTFAHIEYGADESAPRLMLRYHLNEIIKRMNYDKCNRAIWMFFFWLLVIQ